MRLFVGIAISEPIREEISAYMQGLQSVCPNPAAKWLKPESLHVTLKFIGQSERVAEIENVLQSINAPPVQLTFQGVGFFTPRKPQVFWVGVSAERELSALAGAIDERLQHAGVPREPRTYEDYQPHVTLARSGQGRGAEQSKPTMKALQECVSKQASPDFGTMTAEDFILFRSETLSSGARYTPLKRFPLR